MAFHVYEKVKDNPVKKKGKQYSENTTRFGQKHQHKFKSEKKSEVQIEQEHKFM